VAARVRDDMLDAEAMDISAVPTFFINGRRHSGPYDAQSLIRALQASADGGRLERSSPA
jgi:predicted DsbA family dithiol-disulfide isomerase